MFVLQCLIISLVCAISGNAFPLFGRYSYPMLGTSFGWYTLGRPLVGGAICGIILGDVEAGVKLGIAIQLVYLAVVTPGGAVGMDVSFMAYPVIAIGILGHLDAGTTISIASAVGVLGSLTFNVTNIIASLTADKITGALKDHNYKKFTFGFWTYKQLFYMVIRFVPAFIAVYFGAQYIDAFMKVLPDFVLTGMSALGGVLPAVGIAALLTTTVHNKFFILYFLVGFTLVVFMNINIIGLTFVAGGIAYLFYVAGEKKETPLLSTNNVIEEDEEVL